MTDTQEAVAARIREYSDMFGRSAHEKNPSLMRPYCHVPSMAIGRGRVVTIDTPEANDRRWQRAAESLPDDYHHSVLHTVDVTLTDPGTAWVTADCGRFNDAGLEYHRFLASYLVVLVDDEWKITTWIGHGPDEPRTSRH